MDDPEVKMEREVENSRAQKETVVNAPAIPDQLTRIMAKLFGADFAGRLDEIEEKVNVGASASAGFAEDGERYGCG